MVRMTAPVMFVFLLLSACASSDHSESTVDQPLVEDKYRLSADREAFEEIRSQVPEDKRRENDEVAFALQWMGEVKMPPGQVREKFNSAVSKRRSQFQKDMSKRREEFVRKERMDREAFSKEQEAARKEFRGRKTTPDERKAFFGELDQKRRDFYSGSRERRDAFEADMRDRRKNFDDYIRERTSEFNQEHRAYTKRYDEMKKERELKKRQEQEARRKKAQEMDDEFKELDRKKGRPLGTEE